MSPRLELWGGIECTVNRVGDRYHDQLEWNGHAWRTDDLARIASLGIRRLRYPVLWERTAPHGLASADWTWADERLGALRSLGIEPIVTLTHHGSGIRSASLLDAHYASALAEYAAAFAARYPWVAHYTPVNEPLTTARFAALYGHWYPHARDDRSFTHALLAQLRATVLAMRAIRVVRPDAQLVQTEDLGRTRARPALRPQADFENARRWLTWDVLCGYVAPGHAMWDYLSEAGVPRDTLLWHRDNATPADVVGVNTYVTSERFLDERLSRYPVRTHGGNRQTRYADVEAVRVSADGVIGPGPLLQEAWERYRRPVAVTEAHIGCTREEQLRWLRDVWRAAHEARAAGANVVAVTAWALLGTHNWHNLVTHDEGHYEPGAFDTRTEPPRATALADAIRELAAGRRRPSHPAVAGRGWWARPDRLTYPPARGDGPARAEARAIDTPRTPRRTIALLTRHGAMRDMVLSACARRGLRVVRLRVPGASTDDAVQRLRAALTNARAWAVIDLPAPTAARRSRRASAIERAAAEQGIPLLRLAERTRRRSGAGVLHVAAHDPAFAPERLVDDALDLLIDGATGWWTCNAQGAHPTTARTVATRRP